MQGSEETMAGCGKLQAAVRFCLAGLLLAPLFACGSHKEEPETASAAPASVDTAKVAAAPAAPVTVDPRLQQSFVDATLAEPPLGDLRPPETTATGKSVGKLYEDVVKLWDGVKYVDSHGKNIVYKAVLDTDLGSIEITLRPDLAPNHVRSFIALARAGYYNGLVFERTDHGVSGDDGADIEFIEAGCPLGTGEMGYGSIGYWLKPEFHPDAINEDGTVGAMPGEDSDTSTCKFYIACCAMPSWDQHRSVFGKVTEGLEVAHRILSLPVRNDTPEGDLPLKPVVIRKVTIVASEVEKPGVN
jgi:cyclophilin family peptidyl-prolyl cis-trans isomerase